jgi:hypothetical protein
VPESGSAGLVIAIGSEHFRRALVAERRAIEIFERETDYRFIETPKGRTARVDGVVCRFGELSAAVEVKSRFDMTLDEFQGERESKWLISHSKLRSGRDLSALLGVPLVGFLYIVKNDVLLVGRLVHETGEYAVDVSVETRITTGTKGVGVKLDEVAFVDFSRAKVFVGSD